MKATLTVEVSDNGYTEAVLHIDGTPVGGHGDSTGSLPVTALTVGLVRMLNESAERARCVPA